MLNFLIGILIIFFAKEFIILNQEIIIYSIFLSILFFCIKSFASLDTIFENIRSNEKSNLNLNSKNEKNFNDTLNQRYLLNSALSPIYKLNLPSHDIS
uniref:Hypothetical mitochondrial protein 25 n=1 Tax=Physarum polycephalum TaxID=5791 RepID=F2Y9T9_PHYPO|nr:hypothetical mitochondrial protein 25 [Physarum polycephalum]